MVEKVAISTGETIQDFGVVALAVECNSNDQDIEGKEQDLVDLPHCATQLGTASIAHIYHKLLR